eukprot:TRINITY_DN2860_c0_g1_i9.p1 TRINITY_DN2860_c0_g1~~TRINITY_DN2860_c0_g1_i9.p1  ORF type:complete len:156 (+),score=35.80 TRINITY_DN2860_c0_g1_i9:51-518(+)
MAEDQSIDRLIQEMVKGTQTAEMRSVVHQVESHGSSEKQITHQTRFTYGICKILSPNISDVHVGIAVMSELRSADKDQQLVYDYYTILGHYRLGDLPTARRMLEVFLQKQPHNTQAISLYEHILDRIKREGIYGVSIVTAGVVLLGSIAIGLLRK